MESDKTMRVAKKWIEKADRDLQKIPQKAPRLYLGDECGLGGRAGWWERKFLKTTKQTKEEM